MKSIDRIPIVQPSSDHLDLSAFCSKFARKMLSSFFGGKNFSRIPPRVETPPVHNCSSNFSSELNEWMEWKERKERKNEWMNEWLSYHGYYSIEAIEATKSWPNWAPMVGFVVAWQERWDLMWPRFVCLVEVSATITSQESGVFDRFTEVDSMRNQKWLHDLRCLMFSLALAL